MSDAPPPVPSWAIVNTGPLPGEDADVPSSRQESTIHLLDNELEYLNTTVAGTEDVLERLLRSAMPPDEVRLDFGEPVAKGGAGVILLVRDRALRRTLALKLLHERCASDPFLVRGFLREAQVTAQLDHPNIVPVHELRLADNRPFFTMTLIEGESLEERLQNTVLLDYEAVVDFLEIITKVCDALDFAHNRGVLHCDLKPANIMVGEFGQVYLMDWGGAETFEDAEAEARHPDRWVRDTLPALPTAETEGKVFGTPAYMAPERALGLPADVRSDVFAVGALIYEFINGHAPFAAENHTTAFLKARACQMEPLDEEQHGGALPRELFRIVRRAMAADPAGRHASIAELKADLARIVRGGGSFPSVSFPAGSLVIREGDAGDAAYIVAAGDLEVTKEIDGKIVVLRQLRRGDVFGEMAIFASSPRTANVVAVSDVTLIRITEEVIREELDSMKPWMAAFVRTLAERFRERETQELATMGDEKQGGGDRSWWKKW